MFWFSTNRSLIIFKKKKRFGSSLNIAKIDSVQLQISRYAYSFIATTYSFIATTYSFIATTYSFIATTYSFIATTYSFIATTYCF